MCKPETEPLVPLVPLRGQIESIGLPVVGSFDLRALGSIMATSPRTLAREGECDRRRELIPLREWTEIANRRDNQ